MIVDPMAHVAAPYPGDRYLVRQRGICVSAAIVRPERRALIGDGKLLNLARTVPRNL